MKAKQILTKQALHNLFEKVQGGSFAVKYKNGETQHYGEDEPQFRILFNDGIASRISPEASVVETRGAQGCVRPRSERDSTR